MWFKYISLKKKTLSNNVKKCLIDSELMPFEYDSVF